MVDQILNGAGSQNTMVEPDFKRLVDCLRNECVGAKSLASNIRYLTNTLKNIDEIAEKSVPEPSPKEPASIIDHLWIQVWDLKDTNKELEMILNHLKSIIGT